MVVPLPLVLAAAQGQQLLDQEQFDRLADEMKKLDIEVGGGGCARCDFVLTNGLNRRLVSTYS